MSKSGKYLRRISLLITIIALPLFYNVILTGQETYWSLLILQICSLVLLYFLFLMNGFPRKQVLIAVVAVVVFQFLASLSDSDRIYYTLESSLAINKLPQPIYNLYAAIENIHIVDYIELLITLLKVVIITTLFMKYDFESIIYIVASCVFFLSPVIIGLKKSFEQFNQSEVINSSLKIISGLLLEFVCLIAIAFLLRIAILRFKRKRNS